MVIRSKHNIDMSINERHPAKVWTGVILFFGIAVSIAVWVAFRLLDRSSSMAGAIILGAIAGGFGACFVFYIVYNARKWIKRHQ